MYCYLVLVLVLVLKMPVLVSVLVLTLLVLALVSVSELPVLTTRLENWQVATHGEQTWNTRSRLHNGYTRCCSCKHSIALLVKKIPPVILYFLLPFLLFIYFFFLCHNLCFRMVFRCVLSTSYIWIYRIWNVNNVNRNTTKPTGQDESDESEKRVAAPEYDTRECEMERVRGNLLQKNHVVLLYMSDHNHLLLLLLTLLLINGRWSLVVSRAAANE